MHRWPISKNDLSARNNIFLDLNLVGNTKKHERIQNLHILWKMYRENWPLEANFRQKRICKKNVRLQFGQNQKFLIYKLFRLIFVTSCIEGIFDFSKIEARLFFLQKKNIFGFTFHPVEQNMQYFGNHLPVAAVLKLKWKLSDQGYWKMTKGTVLASFVTILEGSLPKRCIFWPELEKNCHDL